MRKILILLFLMFIFLLNTKGLAYTANRIDLQIKKNEISLVFIRLKHSKSILIKDQNSDNLFILDYKNGSNIINTLKIFGSKPNIYFLNNGSKVINHIKIYKKKNNMVFKIKNYNLCVIDNTKPLKSCDFIYIMDLNYRFSVNNFKTILYDESISKEYLKDVQESWIDNYIVSTDGFTILKINKESYNFIIVPSTNN